MALSDRRVAVVRISSAYYLFGTSLLDMEKSGINRHALQWYRIAGHPLAITLMLAMICLGLHYSALSGGWRFDDGPHLFFTANYSPWQYFFVPDIMRQQSWAHITPWNAFFYELGLPFFGLRPAGHYAHLIAILYLSAVASFLLLRLWFNSLTAFMGSALFLSMPATGTIAQLLMTGHYAYGLLFTILAFYCFVRGLRENNLLLSVIAAGFYALACLSKELYVPIIAILFFYPEKSLKDRLHHLWALLSIAIIYVVVRLVVLQGIGGYGQPPILGQLSWNEILADLFTTLLGNQWIAGFIGLYCIISLLVARTLYPQKIDILFVLSIVITIAFPIFPILQNGFGDALSSRVLLFIGWIFAMTLAWLTHLSRVHAITLIIVASALTISQQQTIATIAGISSIMEKQNQFLIENEQNGLLLPFQFKDLNYLAQMQKTRWILTRMQSPALIRSDKELIALDEKNKKNLHTYNDACRCVESLTESQVSEITNKIQQQLTTGHNQSIGIHVAVEDQGKRKLLQWEFSGPSGQFLLHIQNYGRLTLPASGKMAFGIDVTGPANRETLAYVYLVSPEGWIARSPDFVINPSITNAFSWSGRSIIH